MTLKQYKVATAKALVNEQESRTRQAQRDLDEGYKKGEAQVAIAKSDAEREYSRLKEELERAKSQLEREKNWLIKTEADLETGFDA